MAVTQIPCISNIRLKAGQHHLWVPRNSKKACSGDNSLFRATNASNKLEFVGRWHKLLLFYIYIGRGKFGIDKIRSFCVWSQALWSIYFGLLGALKECPSQHHSDSIIYLSTADPTALIQVFMENEELTIVGISSRLCEEKKWSRLSKHLPFRTSPATKNGSEIANCSSLIEFCSLNMHRWNVLSEKGNNCYSTPGSGRS